jgi:hypothetical protein
LLYIILPICWLRRPDVTVVDTIHQALEQQHCAGFALDALAAPPLARVKATPIVDSQVLVDDLVAEPQRIEM